MGTATSAQRHPRGNDLQPILNCIWDGMSLRQTCRELGLHCPSVSDWLHGEPEREEHYARAREARDELLQEQSIAVARAAALQVPMTDDEGVVRMIEPNGARVYLDAIKWTAGRMSPKKALIDPVRRLIERTGTE